MKALLFVMAAGISVPTGTANAQTTLSAQDVAQIHGVVDGLQAAWNRHDMTAFVNLMTDDVEWVNIVGMA